MDTFLNNGQSNGTCKIMYFLCQLHIFSKKKSSNKRWFSLHHIKWSQHSPPLVPIPYFGLHFNLKVTSCKVKFSQGSQVSWWADKRHSCTKRGETLHSGPRCRVLAYFLLLEPYALRKCWIIRAALRLCHRVPASPVHGACSVILR